MKRLFVCVVALVMGVGLVQSQSAVDVAIDVAASRHPIDPRIYGVAHADTATLADLKIPFHRWGGNVSTRHNWQANASNRGGDWYFESIADGPATAGLNADNFVNDSKSNGAQAIITIPMAGWVAKVGPSRNSLASFSVAKYGAQTSVDPWFTDAGNGVRASNGTNITGNDPNDANTPSDATFQRGWVQHLVTRWGNSSGGGVRYYALDNEPNIWHVTHRDIHPNGTSMDELFNASVAHATMIKSVDSGAQILGPEEWGWSGYLYSGRDLQYGAANGWSNLPDRAAHGNMDFVAWYLQQFRQRDTSAGQRLLDIFSLHYYPQGGEYGNDTSTAMQQRRNRSTRALWDPGYVDESWIGTQVQLIPRMKNWVATYYPGTKLAITEYSWGAEGHINGATAQADILGIFGREGLDAATYWTFPAASTPAYKAIKMYRNYDGQGSGFGDTSVAATAPNPDALSVFAAQRGTGTLTIMAINKDLSVAPSVNLRLSNFTPSGAIQVWRLSSSNAITRLADTTASGGTITASLPTQTITLFVVPGQGGSTPTTPAAPINVRILGGTPSAPASVAVSSGAPQSTAVNTAFGAPLRATVRDGSGNLVSGANVTFAAPGSGASATFGGSTSATAATDTSGVATSPALTANGQTGTYNVTATVSGVPAPATFSLTNTTSGGAGGNGTWVNVTPSNVNMGSMGCGNFGTITVVSDPARPSNLYTHFDCQGIWRSTDYGQTWTGPINTGSGGAGANGAGGIAIARGPAGQPPILYSAGIRGSGNGFWRSTDGGVSWTNHIVGPGGSRQDFYPPVVDPYNGDHILLAGHEMNLLVQSFDGGRNWSSIPMSGGMNQNGGTAYLYFVNTGNASTTATTWLYSAQATGGSIGTWRTSNGGASWQRVDSNEHPHGTAQYYQPDTGGVVYMAGIYSGYGWGVLRSTDYGQTWSHVGSTLNSAVVWGTPNRVYAMYSWACGACTVPTSAQSAPQPGASGWTSMSTPGGMSAGAAQAAVVYDGSRYVVVTANWLAGLWRYVE